MRNWVRFFTLSLGLGFLCLLFFGADFYRFLTVPGAGAEQVFKVESGQSLQSIAYRLEREKIITSAGMFHLLARLRGKEKQIQAGEFLIPSGQLPGQVLVLLTRGKPLHYSLTIPEGLTWWQTGELLEQAGYCSFSSFAEVVNDASFLSQYAIKAPNAEGFLFPSTYFFVREEKGDAKKIVARLLTSFWEKTGLDSEQKWEDILAWVIMASLIEKETSLPEERARISGVFANRMRLNMRLQCDPTVIYGLGPDFDGNLTRVHLRDRQNIFNTYAHGGLPPTPICSVGRAALDAARFPEQHDLLYFVSMGNGRHSFSSNLKDHNRAVYRYQRRSQ